MHAAPAARRSGRNVRRVAIVEAPRAPCPVTRVINTDACGARGAGPGRAAGRLPEPQLIAQQVDTVQAAIDVQRTAQQTRAPGPCVEPAQRLERTQQHRVRHARGAGDDVEAVPEAVDEVYV